MTRTEHLLDEIAEIEALLAEWEAAEPTGVRDPDVAFVIATLTRCLEKRRRLLRGELH